MFEDWWLYFFGALMIAGAFFKMIGKGLKSFDSNGAIKGHAQKGVINMISRFLK
jgi:hypothetical protein